MLHLSAFILKIPCLNSIQHKQGERQYLPAPKGKDMPLRGLLYFAKQYEGWIASHRKDIYSRKLLKIPTPQFCVLYNGMESHPEREEYHLTEAFVHPTQGYNWTAHVININSGKNLELVTACSTLAGYTELINQICSRKISGEPIESAVHQAVKYCIKNDILKTYLLKNESEVTSMILTEYDKELHNETLREEGMEDGLELAKTVFTLYISGKSNEDIAKTVNIPIETVKKILY